MPRVLLVHEPPEGGVPRHVLLLARELADQGFVPEVAGPAESNVAAELAAAGIAFHPIPQIGSYRSLRANVTVLRTLVALIRDRRFDLVHAHSSKAGVHGRIAATLARVPSVYTPHCFAFVGPVSRARKLGSIWIERLMAPLTRRIICVAEAERQAALEAHVTGARRLRVILNGVPAPDPAVTAAPDLLAFSAGHPLVAAVNALRGQKRSDLVLAAAPAIWRRLPEVRIALVGNGPEETTLRAEAERLGVAADPRFALLPFVAPGQRYLAQLDALLLASDWEALPLTLMEAQANSIPQVVSAIPGSDEVTTPDTGALFTPGDPEALADAVVSVLSDPARRAEMAAASRRRWQERFRLETMVAQTVALYREVLG